MSHTVEIEWTVETEDGFEVVLDVTAEYTEGKRASGPHVCIDDAYPAEGPWVEDVEARRRNTGEAYELDPYTVGEIEEAICEQVAEGRRGRRW